ncbi:MAG: signal peptidase II [Nitrospinae bacterium]|nr:signal peptidase II [Nitrospinota bacterium]
MNKKYSPLIITLFAVVVIDQITKFYIAGSFELYQSVEIINGFFNITYIRNSGVAFGMFSGLKGPMIKIFFIVISLIAAVTIVILYRGTDDKMLLTRIAFSLILSGAVGNLIDRVASGEVVDFLDFHWHEYHWPAFNVADSCITVGVGLLMITMVKEGHQSTRAPEHQ